MKHKELIDAIANLIKEREEKIEATISKAISDIAFDVNLKDDSRTVEVQICKPDGSLFTKEFSIPSLIYRDVYQEGTTYTEGDAVTKDGSLWIAREKAITEEPGKSSQWRLAVKRGKDAK